MHVLIYLSLMTFCHHLSTSSEGGHNVSSSQSNQGASV